MSMDWKANDRRGDDTPAEKSKISAGLVIWIIIAVLAVFFIVQNARDANVKFLFFDGTMSLWLVIVISIVIGVLLDRLGTWYLRRRKEKKAADGR